MLSVKSSTFVSWLNRMGCRITVKAMAHVTIITGTAMRGTAAVGMMMMGLTSWTPATKSSIAPAIELGKPTCFAMNASCSFHMVMHRIESSRYVSTVKSVATHDKMVEAVVAVGALALEKCSDSSASVSTKSRPGDSRSIRSENSDACCGAFVAAFPFLERSVGGKKSSLPTLI